VLSNTNALEVEGLRDLDNQLLEDMVKPGFENSAEKDGVLGSVVGLSNATVDALRAVEAFKPTQGWGLFRRPGVLVRDESVALSRKIVEAEKEKRVLRLVIDGDKGTGKSLMLVQALATANLRGWVILNIPEGTLHSIVWTEQRKLICR
jgi:small subunit ribosomal protein S29